MRIQKGMTYEEYYGKERAVEIKEKLGNSSRGKTYEERYGAEKAMEMKKSRSKLHKGKKLSKKTIQKLRQAHKNLHNGEKNNFYGKKHTEEALEKMSVAASKRTGNKNPNWRGGKAIKYASWRKAVFERDGYACQRCLARSGFGKAVYLQAHHIIRVLIAPEEKYEVNNGATLCRSCHMFIHRTELRDGFNEIRLTK